MEISKRLLKTQQEISTITSYMRKRGISLILQQKVRKYVQYKHEEQEQEDNETCEQMIADLPLSLNQELLRETYYKILSEEKIFKLNFSEDFLKELALKMKEKQVSEEVIFREGDVPQQLFILMKGRLESFLNKPNNSEQHSSSSSRRKK